MREPEGSGTLIYLDDSNKADPYYDQRPRRPTAVTVKHQITVVNVHSHRKVGSPEFLAQICATLARWSLSVDLFEFVDPSRRSMTLLMKSQIERVPRLFSRSL